MSVPGDALAGFRERFAFPDPDLVYLDGNSLGRLPRDAAERAGAVVAVEWGDRLIKLAVTALDRMANRPVVLTDDLNFPADRYVLEAAASRAEGLHRVEVAASPDGVHGPVDSLLGRLGEDVALVSLSAVTYEGGYRYDVAQVTAAAHEVGAMVLWDLSHAAGAVPLDLAGTGVDLAVGCTYKYLNGGPGAPAFLYVRSDLQDELADPIAGWWGHADPFAFHSGYRPARGIRRFLTGTAPVVSMALIEPGVAIVAEAGLAALRERSLHLTGHLIGRWRTELAPLGFTLRTPGDPERRGSHVALGHPQALAIDLALIAAGVIPDFRPPDAVRFGIAPLYNTITDVDRAVDATIGIVTSGRHLDPVQRPAVT